MTYDSKTSQVLSPTEEEELAKDVTKMGERGPVIFDRHFFTLVGQTADAKNILDAGSRCNISPEKS